MDVYAGLSDRVLVGDGETWADRLQGRTVECVAADARAPERAFVGTVEAGLQRTTDGGETWTEALATDDRVTSVTVAPHDPDVVWAGTEPSAVYRSTDGGESWTERGGLTDMPSAPRWSFPPRPHTHHVRWIAVAPDDPEQLYVAIEAGAFVRSPDGGATWDDHPDGARRDTHTLATHADAPDRVYTAAGDGYARSDDRGETWATPQAGLDHRYVWSVAVHPADPEVVVVSAASGPYTAHSTTGESYVYRRTGGAWTRAMAGLPAPDGLARAVLATDAEAFYALTNHGLFRSTDGREWDAVGPWCDAYDQVPRGLAVV
ncbi:WD40/YVTN/BNR-like repeat-containing protein [Halomicroarcula sp. GCM10025817]|uniref:WD40/YVTN/BNR-like repeat-containing protein n=1 Tax=Halomicroarcula sp. GCM10025817 TaxID=3252672 RepID=UPI00360F2700